jgi:hypothetical protein
VTVLAGTRAPGAGSWRSWRLTRLGWVSWRQHRATLLGLGLFAALIAGYALIEGLKVHHLYNSAVRDGCVNPTVWTGPCRPLLSPFYVGWPLSFGDQLGLLLPLFAIVVGMFLGAPLLAREYTSGTTRFAWTQGTGRARLTVTKVVLLGLAVMAVAALLGWLGQWSMQPIVALSNGEFDRWQPGLFTTTPVTETAAAALAFAVGLLASAVIRHVVPAMAATLVATITVAELFSHRLHLWPLARPGLVRRPGRPPAERHPGRDAEIQPRVAGPPAHHVPGHVAARRPVLAVPVHPGRRRATAGPVAGRAGPLADPAPARVAAVRSRGARTRGRRPERV